MQALTPAADQAVQSLSQRYGVSTDAVRTLLDAVNAGGGTMAQFWHNELGGGGQWLAGGMTMVGDMFNTRLQSTVSGLCSELSQLLATTQVYPPLPAGTGFGSFGSGSGSNNWWPGDLGLPSSSGGQNDSRYAVFPQTRRLAIQQGGQVTVYDTLDHSIGGVQQAQGGNVGSLSFSSQFGTFTVDSLPRVSPPSGGSMSPPPYEAPAPAIAYAAPSQMQPSTPLPSIDVMATIRQLAELHQQGVLTDSEFSTKKAELLSRL